ncbi:MAG: deoxyribodipyrimidine photolyase [Flavobacteriaceae bacterium]|nr:deoxyribodipyrimidine photolyase [Flavobacteriaceae bacterium]
MTENVLARHRFPTDTDTIIERMLAVDLIRYGKTRNFLDGAVTYLSPYISRGILSTKMVMESVLNRGYPPNSIEKFLQELAWRDYWQQLWIAMGHEINSAIRQPQSGVENRGIAQAILDAQTGIDAIDNGLKTLYETGYMHNHLRMYVASIVGNISKSHWLLPARWMYYHLLDADWASNALSWQWVVGANSSKKYYANQGNINTYCQSDQHGTFLDVSYDEIVSIPVPDALEKIVQPVFYTPFPESDALSIVPDRPTLIYNFYNLDPNWMADKNANRILLLEPSVFAQYPIGQQSVDFMMALAKNIPGIQVFVGEFEALKQNLGMSQLHYKEHPLNRHYEGIETPRDWMFSVNGYYRSFFAFWKRCKKEL